jgi:hypothetical protein
MNVADKLSTLIDRLEQAVSYDDWEIVSECIREMNFMYEEMESTFPLESYDDED